MLDPTVVVKQMEVRDEYIAELRIQNQKLEKQLRFAAGVISTMPDWSDKHPEEVLVWIRTSDI